MSSNCCCYCEFYSIVLFYHDQLDLAICIDLYLSIRRKKEHVRPEYMFFFYKHMKFRSQAHLCLAVFDFEAHIMRSSCLTFQGPRIPVWEKLQCGCEISVNQFLMISIDL